MADVSTDESVPHDSDTTLHNKHVEPPFTEACDDVYLSSSAAQTERCARRLAAAATGIRYIVVAICFTAILVTSGSMPLYMSSHDSAAKSMYVGMTVFMTLVTIGIVGFLSLVQNDLQHEAGLLQKLDTP